MSMHYLSTDDINSLNLITVIMDTVWGVMRFVATICLYFDGVCQLLCLLTLIANQKMHFQCIFLIFVLL